MSVNSARQATTSAARGDVDGGVVVMGDADPRVPPARLGGLDGPAGDRGPAQPAGAQVGSICWTGATAARAWSRMVARRASSAPTVLITCCSSALARARAAT